MLWTFVIWQNGLDNLEPFQEHLNSLQDTSKFIMETESKGQLPFLDVLVKRDDDKLTSFAFRKNNPHKSETLLQITSLPMNKNQHNFMPETQSTKSVQGY